MSATSAQLQPNRETGRTAPRKEERRSRLQAVLPSNGRRTRPRLLYAGMTVLMVLAIVVTQLLLSIGVTQGAYQIRGLQEAKTSLQRQHQAISEDVDKLSSPQNLAANANALGMVNNGTPVFLRLSDGAVLGAPTAASAAAGTVTGAAGNLVPNALLNGVPLVTQTPDAAQDAAGARAPASPATSGSAAKSAATPGAKAPQTPDGPVALDGALPAPTTH